MMFSKMANFSFIVTMLALAGWMMGEDLSLLQLSSQKAKADSLE